MRRPLRPKAEPARRKSASKIGSMTIFTAAWTIRSRIAGIDSGRRSCEPGFGMNTRRAGNGR
jgi:hypothetical protein